MRIDACSQIVNAAGRKQIREVVHVCSGENVQVTRRRTIEKNKKTITKERAEAIRGFATTTNEREQCSVAEA